MKYRQFPLKLYSLAMCSKYHLCPAVAVHIHTVLGSRAWLVSFSILFLGYNLPVPFW